MYKRQTRHGLKRELKPKISARRLVTRSDGPRIAERSRERRSRRRSRRWSRPRKEMTKRRQTLVTTTKTLISMMLIKYIAKPKDWLDSLIKTSLYSKKSDDIARNRRGEKIVS